MESSSFRIVPIDGKPNLLFQAFAPEHAIHPGSEGGVQVVLHWTREHVIACLATMLRLLRRGEFVSRDGFRGGEGPPRVVPIALGHELAPPDVVCRVVVEAALAAPHEGQGCLSVELTHERIGSLAERLLRRGGLARVWLADGLVAWEDTKEIQ